MLEKWIQQRVQVKRRRTTAQQQQKRDETIPNGATDRQPASLTKYLYAFKEDKQIISKVL
jgi:hypothetical protein